MKPFLALLLSIATLTVTAGTISWDRSYQLQFSDFQSPATQIGKGNTYTLQPASTFSFAYNMTRGEFMFTKNFNEKVDCYFQKDVAAIIAPDSVIATDLLEFARYEFDLAELYARKLRQKLYEGKGAFSDAKFFQPMYDAIQKEYSARHLTAGQETDLGRDREKLKALRTAVLAEIDELTDFCKTCKPAKKKKA